MGKLDLSCKFVPNPDVVYTHIDSDIVMMGPENGLYYAMNGVGAEIWTLLEAKPMSLEGICGHIQKNYSVDTTQCMTDTSTFIDDMIAQKMILVEQ